MFINNIKAVDFNKQYNEKQAKELITSLDRLLSDIIDNLEKLCINNNEEFSFTMSFDNGNNLFITSIKKNDEIITTISYTDYRLINKEYLSLQDALNINKYVYEIEHCLVKNISNNCYEYSGYYTEQPLDKKLHIYKEKEPCVKSSVFLDSDNIELE